MPQVEDTQFKSTQSYVIAYGTMGEKERMKGGVVKVAAYGESCQNHKDTHSRLQLPGLQSFNKVPAGILKLGETLGLICRHAMHTQTHTFTAKKCVLTRPNANT